MPVRWVHGFVFAILLSTGCSEPLDDTTCRRNQDCQEGYACNPQGICQEAPQLQVDAKTLADAFLGEAYSDTLTASGGVPPYTWSLALSDPGETRLAWIEIVAGTGEIRNQTGLFPSELGRDLGINVTVTDESNRGEGQQASREFLIHIKECRGSRDCWEYEEFEGRWGCRQGGEACNDGVLSGECVLSGWSTAPDHCGDACGPCDSAVADRCVQGQCACGLTGGICSAGESCCSGACTDLRDLAHCGDCDTSCQPQHVLSASCDQGACTYDQCQTGFYDCDQNRANGCEIPRGLDNCSGCSDACNSPALYPNTTGQTCPAGVCQYQCVQDYADCDAGRAGCETQLGSEDHCSACNDACTGSATGGNACIDDAGFWRCGCLTEANCDNQDMCCAGVCTPHDTDHCEDCLTGCAIDVGGPECNSDGQGGYLCQCSDDEQCKRYPASAAYCDTGGTDECLCTATEVCAEGLACCFQTGSNACVDLQTDTRHCGICRTNCDAGETCSGGACTCMVGACPDPSGAPNCVNDECVCFFFSGRPCPIGQYCCVNEGCCLSPCGTLNNECSIACYNASHVWCGWGCCESCQNESDCGNP